MTVDALWDVVVVIEWTQVRHHVYAAPLQVDMLQEIDLLQESGVQLNCTTGDLSIGASIASIYNANSPSGLRDNICMPGPPTLGCRRRCDVTQCHGLRSLCFLVSVQDGGLCRV